MYSIKSQNEIESISNFIDFGENGQILIKNLWCQKIDIIKPPAAS